MFLCEFTPNIREMIGGNTFWLVGDLYEFGYELAPYLFYRFPIITLPTE